MLENFDNEEWRDIEDYEGKYQVSNMGRIKSLKYGKERILRTGTIDKYGHQGVNLCKNGVAANKCLHRLVAEAFLPNPENKPCVDHIDTNPRNNCVENLRWCNAKENSQNPLTIEHNKQKSIYCFENATAYESTMEAARQLNVNPGNVSMCCKGKRNHTGGYHFCYADNIKKETI